MIRLAASNPRMERTPTDGRPYYCTHCGAGFAEFMACESMSCTLEHQAAALDRQAKAEQRKQTPDE